MRTFEGYVRMNHIEFEVEDDADDLEIEEAFNIAVLDVYYRGFDGSVDYDYHEVS